MVSGFPPENVAEIVRCKCQCRWVSETCGQCFIGPETTGFGNLSSLFIGNIETGLYIEIERVARKFITCKELS